MQTNGKELFSKTITGRGDRNVRENSYRCEFQYRDDFLISYRVYMMTGSFHISLFEGTLHVDKIQV